MVEDAPGSTTTLRQRLEAMTAVQPCKSCHDRIGPPGFAFLPFDPVGRFNRNDASGKPFDTTGTLLVKGTPVPFTSASDMAAKLAADPASSRCVSRRLFRWAFGRFESAKDKSALAALEAEGASSEAGVTELLRHVVGSTGFAQVRLR
jgi:hypothetical protein